MVARTVEGLLPERQHDALVYQARSENVVFLDARTAALNAVQPGELNGKRSLPKGANTGVDSQKTLPLSIFQDRTTPYPVSGTQEDIGIEESPLISEKIWESVYSRRELDHQPLLSRDEEIALGTLIEQGAAARVTLAARRFKTDAERIILEHEVGEGSEARRIFIEANKGLAVSCALRKVGRAEFADLKQGGYLGLINAIDGYDWRKGKFSTYAMDIIMQEIGDTVRLSSTEFTLKEDMWRDICRLRDAQIALWAQLEREPTLGEVGAQLSLTERMLENRKPILQSVFVSLQEPIRTEAEEICLQDTVLDTSLRLVDDEAINNSIAGKIESDFIETLSPEHRQVVPLVFEGKQPGLQKRLAEEYGVSHTTIQNRRASVVRMLITYLSELNWLDGPQAAFS